MKMSPNAIELDHLSYTYDSAGSPILDQLNLAIPRGSICAILGPNGSGKTTLLHLLLGLLKPLSGKLSLLGHSMNGSKSVLLKQMIGLVPQKETLPFELSVLEYVLLGRAPHLGIFDQPGEEDRNIARRFIESVGLQDLTHRSVPSLSGGEHQLAMVARALTQETEILLMDEPTAHLDLANTKTILQIMRSLHQNEKTIIYTTNDPNAASLAADYMVLIKQGSIVASGTTKSVFTTGTLSAVYGIDVEVMWSNERPYAVLQMD